MAAPSLVSTAHVASVVVSPPAGAGAGAGAGVVAPVDTGAAGIGNVRAAPVLWSGATLVRAAAACTAAAAGTSAAAAGTAAAAGSGGGGHDGGGGGGGGGHDGGGGGAAAGADDGARHGGARRTQPSVFLAKTYEMMDDPTSEGIVGWGAGGASIVIHKVGRFTDEVLPRHFKNANYASFVRQLNLYGFRKAGSDPSAREFAHPDFRAGNRGAIQSMKRKAAPSGADGPALKRGRKAAESAMDDLSRLQARQASMEATVDRLRAVSDASARESALLWNELRASRERQALMQEKMRQIVYIMYDVVRSAHSAGVLPAHVAGALPALIKDMGTSPQQRPLAATAHSEDDGGLGMLVPERVQSFLDMGPVAPARGEFVDVTDHPAYAGSGSGAASAHAHVPASPMLLGAGGGPPALHDLKEHVRGLRADESAVMDRIETLEHDIAAEDGWEGLDFLLDDSLSSGAASTTSAGAGDAAHPRGAGPPGAGNL